MPLSVFRCGPLDFPPERRQMDSLLAHLDRWCTERGMDAVIVVDVELKEIGKTQTEAVVFAFNRAFIIELKSFRGRVYAHRNEPWLVDDGRGEPFPTPSNPLEQTRKHRYLVRSHFLRLLYPNEDPMLWEPGLTHAPEDPRSRDVTAKVHSWVVVEPGTWIDYGDIDTARNPWFRIAGLDEVTREMEREYSDARLPEQLPTKFIQSLHAEPVDPKDWMRIPPSKEHISLNHKRSATVEALLKSREESQVLNGLSIISELGLRNELPEVLDLARSGLSESRKKALSILDSWGSPAMRNWAMEALKGDGSREKQEALSWVAAHPSPIYVPLIRNLAHEADSPIRRKAIAVLAEFPWDEATKALVDLGRAALSGATNLSSDVWTVVLKGIGRPGFHDATLIVGSFLAPGQGALEGLEPWTVESLLGFALDAAGKIADPRLMDKVVPLLDWNGGELRQWALHAIAEMAGKEQFDLLVSYLNSDNEWIQLSAIRGLERIGGERAFTVLLRLFVETLSRDRLSMELAESLSRLDPVAFGDAVARHLSASGDVDLERKSDLMWSMIGKATPEVAKAALPYLRYPETWMDACNVISQEQIWSSVRTTIRDKLTNGNEFERSAAILAFSSMEGVSFEQELRAYEGDPSEFVQSHIIDAYGYFKSAYAESRLLVFTIAHSPKIVRDAIWELEHNADWFRYDVATVGLKDWPMSGTMVMHRTGIYFHDKKTGLALPMACIKQIVEVHPIRGRPGLLVDGDSPHLPRIFATPGDHTDYLWADRELDEWTKHMRNLFPAVKSSRAIDEGLDGIVRQLYERLLTLEPASSGNTED